MHASSYFTIMIQRGGWFELLRVGGEGKGMGRIKSKKEKMAMIDLYKRWIYLVIS